MTKTKLFILFFPIILFVPSVSRAEDATTTVNTLATSTPATTTPTVLGLQSPAVPPLVAITKQAKEELTKVKLNYVINPVYNKSKKITGYKLGLRDLFVAIYQPDTGQISVTGAMQNGKTFKFPDKNFDIKLVSFNGVNSKFQVNKPEGAYVVALKYLITPVESGSKASITNSLYEATYVPYSASLNQPDVVAYGEQYVANLIDRVSGDLQHLPSQAIPGKMIPEAIRPALVRALVYAEHTDTSEVIKTADIKGTIGRLNVLFATNENDTYRYSGSSVGARGIAQFMPATYKSLAERHPEAGLITDFDLAMASHYNSIKAMYMLLDDYAGSVRAKSQNGGFAEGQVFDYGAAAYNAGTVRVARAVNAFGRQWYLDQSSQVSAAQTLVANLKAQIKKAASTQTKAALQSQLNEASDTLETLKAAALRNETVNYLQKIYKVIPVFNSDQN